MASDSFTSEIIYKTFIYEYKTFLIENGGNYGSRLEWIKFIESKDLGIIWIAFDSFTESFNCEDYKITDHKKWLITKIKYGF